MRTKNNRKIFYITWSCVLIIVAVSAWALFKSYRPSEGNPYERLTPQEAVKYMSYEGEYVIADVRSDREYREGHLPDAVCLPFDQITENAETVIGNKEKTVYVYGSDTEQSCAAAQKLSDMGFTSVAEIGNYDEWMKLSVQTETESILTGALG